MSIATFLRWSDDQYFGEVVRIDGSDFWLRTGGEGDRLIRLSQFTVIKKGREPLKQNLNIGDHVIVVGKPGQDGSVMAGVIRIVKPPSKKPI
jgi:hypothetical protein